MKNCRYQFRAFIFLALLLTSCAGVQRQATGPGSPDGAVCADLSRLPQHLENYVEADKSALPVLPAENILAASERARDMFFKPWRSRAVSPKKARDSMWDMYALNPSEGFAENLRPYPPERWEDLVSNCNAGDFGRSLPFSRPAILVRNASFRAMPTDTPFFYNPEKPGEGYPFDMFQKSSFWVGTPVAVLHESKDRAWLLVETAIVSGWVRAGNVAFVDAAFMERWREAPLAAVTRDKTLLEPVDGSGEITPGRYAHVGALLPSAGSGAGGALALLTPGRDARGEAFIGKALVRPAQAEAWPIPFTRENAARLGSTLVGQPYGWGGLNENRDCSALTRDFLLSFGLWLPRNSKNQAAVGEVIKLGDLGAAEKEKAIMEKGVPFLSLIGLPGHITLYLGVYDGKAVMLHNIWGLRIKRAEGEDGRAVIGKAVITTLRPGAERGDISTPDSLLDRVGSLNTPGLQ